MTTFANSKADVLNNRFDAVDKPILDGRGTTAERDALPNIIDGMKWYNTTTNKFQGRANSSWVDFHA